MPDIKQLNSPVPSVIPSGVITAEELWNELGAPVYADEGRNASSWTPIEALQSVINRVLRGYVDDVDARLDASSEVAALAHLAEPIPLVVEPSGSNTRLAETKIPEAYLARLFDRVEGPNGEAYSPDDNIAHTAATTIYPVRRYQVSGRTISIYPRMETSVTVWLIPRNDAVKTMLEDLVPEINTHIRKAGANLVDSRSKIRTSIDAESRDDTPST